MSTALRTYFRGRNLVSMRDQVAGKMAYYHFDHQGTTQCLTDSTGAVTDRFASDAWGVQVKRTGDSINRSWYIGNLGYTRQVDQELDYVRARFLTFLGAVWLSKDPIPINAGGDSNYCYTAGRPSTIADPTGLLSITGVLCSSWVKGANTCGGYLAYYKYARLHAGCSGWIVQKVELTGYVSDCSPQHKPVINPYDGTYYEAWRINANQLISPDTQRDGYTDSAHGSRFPQDAGQQTVTAEAFFYCDQTVVADSPANWTTGNQQPNSWCKYAGPLPCKDSLPNWFRPPGDESEKMITRNVNATWTCCNGQTAGTATVTVAGCTWPIVPPRRNM